MKNMVGSFVLSAYIAVAPTGQAYANPEEEALKHIGKACYKEFQIDKFVKQIEKRYLPEELKKYGGPIGVGIRIIAEQKVAYTWTF